MDRFEISLLLWGLNVRAAKAELNSLHKLAGEKYIDIQKERLNEIVCYHRDNNPFYKNLIGDCDVNSFDDLPVITKRDLQRPLESLISKGFTKKNLYISCTSGSSGTPLIFAKNKESHAFTYAVILSCYAQFGINTSSKQARFYCMPIPRFLRYKELLKDFLMKRIRFPVIELSDHKFDVFIRKFKRIKFAYINGYTTALVHFAKYLIRKNIVLKDISPHLKCCIVTSEVCTPDDRELLEKAFGIRIVNEYGASEVGIIAFENPDGEWVIQTDDLFVEVVDEHNKPLPNGKAGKILITSLSNRAFPIIRYEIGDIGIIEEKKDKLILKDLLGRTRDMVHLPSGRIVSGVVFSYISNSLLKSSTVIRELIIRQTKIDSFELDAVMDRELTSDEIKRLKVQMESYLEPGLSLLINKVDKIERPSSGKFKLFYSMIN